MDLAALQPAATFGRRALAGWRVHTRGFTAQPAPITARATHVHLGVPRLAADPPTAAGVNTRWLGGLGVEGGKGLGEPRRDP